MVRRFSWCTVAALVVLLFVTTEGLHERDTQVDDHKTHSAKDRGTLRYNFKSPEETTTSASSLSRPKSTRDRTSNLERHNGGSVLKAPINSEAKVESNRRSNFRTARTTERNGVSAATETTNNSRRTLERDTNDAKKVEPTINRRNGKRYPSENNEGVKSKIDEQNGTFGVPKEVSRTAFNRKSDNSGVTERLDNTGPSVFTATTESSRSRTGRKIQTTYSTTDLKSQVPTSRKFNNKKFEGVETSTVAFRRAEGRGRSTTERTERGRSGRSKVNNRENNAINRRSQDPLLSESESVRVDIPLAVEATESLTVDATTDSVRSQRQSSVDSNKESDTKDSSRANTRTGSERSKHRGRSNHDSDSGNSVSRNGSRRGVSKFNDYSTTEANEPNVSSRRNTGSRDRSKSSEPKKNSPTNEVRPRSRGRNLDNNGKSNSIATSERDVKRKSSGDRNSPERRSRIPDFGPRLAENRGQDQDSRGRSRSRSRVDATTPVTSADAITTPTPDTTVSNDIATSSTETEVTSTSTRASTPVTTTTGSRILTTTARPTTTTTATSEGPGRNRGRGRGGGNQGRKQPKEDFFNHGLGFRGRKPPPEGSLNVGDSRKPTAPKNQSQYHGNPGWTLRRRPGHLNHSEIEAKAIVPSPRDQTNEVIPPNEQSTSTEIITTVESVMATTRRGFKKQQSSTEESSTVAGTTTKSFRRGNKTFEKNKTVGLGKGTAEPDESDNYPPEFKARLSQLKNTNAKAPAPKTTSRAPLEDQLQSIFGLRSMGNSEKFELDDLETSSGNVFLTEQSLVMNPLTLINGAALRRVKKSTASLFAERSRMKLDLARRLVKPELNIEENDLDATTASSFSKPKSTGATAVDKTSKVAKFVKPGAAERRGSTEASQDVDRGSKLSRLGKSLEDSSKVHVRPSTLRKGRIISERMVTSISIEEGPEGTTKSYASTHPFVSTVSAEEGSPITIDSTRIRLSALRSGKQSREDQKPTRDSNVSVTTFKPKKSYVYQSRNSKTQEQSTTVEQTSVTATPKKSYSSVNKQNGTQRKSQASQEESVIKKPKFSEGVTNPTKSTFRPRYSKRTKAKAIDDKTENQTSRTTKVPLATSRYSRKKSIIKSANGKVKVTTTEGPATQTKKQEFRPRTATYRRHSEVPTTLVQTTTKVDSTGVAITPRVPRYHAILKSSTPPSPRSVPQEPQVNLNIVNDTAQQAAGITGNSNGDSGSTNIFNPTRTAILTGNGTLLEQLRSTVAPLLSSLGNKTPIFSGAYSNVNNANSAPRITPNGSPPRFSARYKGAELFVRKQNNIYQPTVPSITSSSTTSVTPVENSGSAPPIDVSSPGEPRFLTFYHALESASIRNEQLQGDSNVQQQSRVDVVPQVDSNVTVANGNISNLNNDTTSPTVATTSPQTPDTTTVQDSTQSLRLSEETESSTPMVTTEAPETPSSTEQASSTESPSTTEQVTTSTESPTTAQASLGTESSSTTEQTSTTPEQATTESLPRNIDTTTMEPQDVRTYARIGNGSNGTTETTTAPTDQNLTSSATPSRIASTDVPVTTTQTSSSSTEGTTSETSTSTPENLETSTIQMSEAPSTQAADTSSTDAPTTEAISDNMIDVETTTVISATTVRSRLIDFAQDILSRLQSSLSTTTEPSTLTTVAPKYGTVLTTVPTVVPTTEPGQDSTTTVSPATEISNVISDSEMKNTLEALAQLKEVGTTTTEGDLGATTLPSSTMDQPALRIAEEMTTQSAVGLVTTPLPTTANDLANDTVSTQEASTQDGMNLVVTTTPTPTTVTTTQGSQTTSNTDSTTMSATTATNDTLLTELMSIAKTLLSEERNETEQLPSSRVGNLMESEVDQQLGTTQAAESSSISPDVTTETVESTTNTVAGSELTTTPVDLSQNEVDSVDLTTTGLPSDIATTTAQSSVLDSEVEVIETNQTTTLGPLAENVESTTPSVTTETMPQMTLSNRISSDSDTSPDTTTQSQTTTRASDTTVTTPTVNFELTTNTYDLVSSNLITTTETQSTSGQTTEVVTESTETTVQLTNFTTVVSQPTMNTSTNQPEVTTASMEPETILARVNIITTMPSTSSDSNTEQTTVVPTSGLVQNETTMPTTTALLDAMDVTEATTNQSPLTSSTEPTTELTTNMSSETTNIPQTTPNLENETPTVVARFQDTTSSTAQGTAGSGIGQTTESTSMTTDSSITPSSRSSTSSPPQSSVATTSSSVETTTGTTATTTTETTISTSIPQTTTVSARMNVVTITPMSETTVPMPVTTVDINENLVSTEASAGTSATTTVSPNNVTLVSRITMNDTSSSTPSNRTAAATETTTVSPQMTTGMTMPTATRPPSSSVPQTPPTPYLGRFGGSRLTPAPRFSVSSTTKAPLRDYLIYGIYPNKTIVRKRPEDNLIDARNVDSPYVIFGIFPDGKLVRKFPNGTIIPDPPRSSVEVVFSLSTTTTTNRPPPRPYYNQANQGTYYQYQGPVYDNNRRPVAEPMRNYVPTPGTVDLGLTGNAIVGPNGGGPDFTGPLGTPASAPSTNEMNNTPMNAQMGTTSNVMSAIAGRPPTDSQGSRIVQDRERDEATRTKEAGGQRSSVYIGQDKFVNYWTDGAPTTNPRVVSVNINSVASAASEGPSPSPTVPLFANLLNGQPGGQMTAPPGFPWRDPLDQIFGITTPSPVITASVASNTLDDSGDANGPAFARPVNPFVEVFTPFSSAIGSSRSNLVSTTQPTTATATTTTAAPLTTMPTTVASTTMAPTTTTTTTMAPTTTTTTMAPTTTTTTMAPSTTTTTTAAPTTTSTTTSAPVTTATSRTTVNSLPATTPFNLPRNLAPNTLQQNAFGTTFDDLQFLNSLLQGNTRSSTTKTLTQVEQLLANKILSLALNSPGPTRAPKAVNIESVSPNSIYHSSPKSLDPIVIDLSPSSTATAPTWQPTPSSSEKPISTTTIKPVELSMPTSTTVKTTLISTTKAPITVTARTTVRPRTTTPPAPLGLGASLWQALFGNGLFAGPTTQRPVRPKQVKTTPKSVNITPKPAPTTQKPEITTLRSVDISKIQVSTPNSIVEGVKSATAPSLISTTKKPLLNNPNPRVSNVATSTFSPEDDAKFLLALLRATQENDNKAADSKKSSSLTQDDESFLRAILSGRALTTTTPAPSNDISDAALLAALLKAQGIEPPTPANNIREQLLLASLGQSVSSAPNALPATESTTITTRPASSATRPTVTTKNTATPRPTSGPRIRTTTWMPSSTYPPPLFSSFSNYGTPVQSAGGDNSGGGALFGATRAFSQFLGAAISGAAQQLQSLVRNGTRRLVSEVVG